MVIFCHIKVAAGDVNTSSKICIFAHEKNVTSMFVTRLLQTYLLVA